MDTQRNRTRNGEKVNRTLRVPAELMERIRLAAAQNHRTINAEIVIRLEESLDREAADTAESLP